MNEFKTKILKWIKQSPEEALLTIIVSAGVMFIAIIFCILLLSQTANNSYGPDDTIEPSKMPRDNGWVFLSRENRGNDRCDLYQKGMSYKVKCYIKDDSGKWKLNSVF